MHHAVMEGQQVTVPFAITVEPTASEFADFQTYVNRLEMNPEVRNCGIVKIKPPPGFVATHKSYEESIQQLYVQSPLEQNFCQKSR